MTESDKTVYKICREQAGYTQEQAAELLHCSVRALSRYENGEAPVPNAVVYAMVRLYNDNFVGIEHLRISSELGAWLIPQVVPRDILTAVVRMVNRIGSFFDRRPDLRLLRIAEDGVIDATEVEELDEILEDLDGLTRAFTEVRLAAERRR